MINQESSKDTAFYQHLEGQVLYRMGEYDKCIKNYNTLHQNAESLSNGSWDASDALVNLCSSHISNGVKDEKTIEKLHKGGVANAEW